MNAIEERLLQDIEAVTSTVNVSEADLLDARTSVDRRIEDRRQGDRRRELVVAAAAAAVVVGFATWQGLRDHDANKEPVGPVPSPTPLELSAVDQAFLAGEAPTPEAIQGVWRLDNPLSTRMLVAFTADGDFRYDDAGQLSENPLAYGTYEIQGNDILVDLDGGTAQCDDQSFAIRASVAEVGKLHVVQHDYVGQDYCGRSSRHQWVLEQQLPTPAGGGFTAPPGYGWDTPLGHAAMRAIWYVGGGGYLVELRTDGTYSVLAGYGEVVDTGLWTDDDTHTRLTMTSTTESSSCESGDQYVLGDLRSKDLGTDVLQGTVERDDCALGLPVGKGWFRLAP